MRNLSSSKPGDVSGRNSSAGLNQVNNQAHAKYKGLISTPGYCKFSAWKRETELIKQPFSRLILNSLTAASPERCWLKDQTTGRSETFGGGLRNTRRLGRSLAQLGVGEGSVVCLWASNYVEYWLLCLAVWDLGGAVLPTNCLTNTERLQQQLQEAAAFIIVCDTYNVDQAIALKQEVSSLKHVLLLGQEEEVEGVLTVSSLLQSPPDIKVKEVRPDWDKATVMLMYTTRNGESKVVKHTNKSLTAMVFSPKGASNNWFDQNVGDCLLCGSWFFHFQGLLSFALCSLQGFTMFFLSEYSDTDLITALDDTKVPNAVLYPWQVRMLSQSGQLEVHDLSQLRVIVTGGTILGPTISRELQEKLPSIKFIRESYGLKETGLLTFNYPKYDRSGSSVPDDHLMPVGLPNMWTSFKIIDRITASPVAGPDLQGELCVKTPQLSSGYLGLQESLLDSEGYFHTGDLGYYDRDGIIHFVEQISNLISFWMYEISPSVLESRLLSHTSVADAAVVSIPDKENGQIPRGFVVLKSGHEETEENLINFLESRLQDHERLRGGLLYIQQIPRDENWKVVKSVLQAIKPPTKYEDLTEKVEPLKEDAEADSVPSPGTLRNVELAAQLLIPNDGKNQHQEAEEIFGMKSRSRRGSNENILETETVGNGGSGVKEEKVESDPPEREGEEGEGEELEYWLPVSVCSSYIERKVGSHPGVSEVVVKGVAVAGVGTLPRAYVTIKPGFSLPGEELASWCNSRLEWRYRVRGGFVILERIPRDSEGKLLINLDKFDDNVVAMRTFSEKEKYPQANGNKTTNI